MHMHRAILLAPAAVVLFTFCSLRDLDYLRDPTCAPHCGVLVPAADAPPDVTVLDGGGSEGGERDACSGYRGTVLCDNPIGYWRLGEEGGSTVAADETQRTPGEYVKAGAIAFGELGAIANDDNTAVGLHAQGWIDAGNAFAFAQRHPFTIEAWVQNDMHQAGAYPRIFEHATFDDTHLIDGIALMEGDNGAIVLSRHVGGQANTASASVDVGPYHHVVATYDGNDLRVYIDGTLRANAPDAREVANLAGLRIVAIGTGGGAGSEWPGKLDEVAVYGVALDGGTVAHHYAVATGNGN